MKLSNVIYCVRVKLPRERERKHDKEEDKSNWLIYVCGSAFG